MTEKKPTFILPVLGQPPEMDDEDDDDIESDWEAGDEAVPHPDASAAPDIEKAFLAAMSGEARPARTCCEEMEVQLGFARSAPVILYDGKSYWLPVAGADRMGARVLYCPWCGKRLEEKKPQSGKKKFKGPGPRAQGRGPGGRPGGGGQGRGQGQGQGKKFRR